MKTTSTSVQTESATGDRSGVLLGRPTIAANSGADIPNKLLRNFLATDLAFAEWIRLPSPGMRCAITGLSRTTLNEAVERGDIRAITVRQPGATRGIKLLHKQSLLDWLARLDVEQNGQETQIKKTAPEGGDAQ